jgi:hypothetical protein
MKELATTKLIWLLINWINYPQNSADDVSIK